MDIIAISPWDSLLSLISWSQPQEPFKLTAKLLNFPIQARTVGNLFKIYVTEKLSISFYITLYFFWIREMIMNRNVLETKYKQNEVRL